MKSVHYIFICIIIPIVLLIQLLITIIHHLVFDIKNHKIFVNSLLTNILFTIQPLLPISYYFFFNFIKFHAIFTIFKIFKQFNSIKLFKQKQSSILTANDAVNLLMQQNIDNDGNNRDGEFLDTTRSSTCTEAELKSYNFSGTKNQILADSLKLDYNQSSIETLMQTSINKVSIKEYFGDIFLIIKQIMFDDHNSCFNQNVSFIFSTNFFFGLGSLTNFSCVDKKGVLSWPNPTAESIVLFKNNSETISNSTTDLNNEETTNTSKNKEIINLETFNLTNDKTDGFRLHFDDSNWLSNLNLLKPLGLSILLNTCNKMTVDYYLKLSDLLKIEADKHERFEGQSNEVYQLKSIGDRRCLCEVSRLMNFEDNAVNSYEIISTCSLYRDSITNTIMRPPTALQKLQIPISSLMSVIAYYKHNGIYNMYCQGTADLVIDFCTDYWDGKEIKRLSFNQKYNLFYF